MATTSFIIDEFTGSDAKVRVTLSDVSAGKVRVSLEVISGYIGDIVGFFANFDGLSVGNNFTLTPVAATPGDPLVLDTTPPIQTGNGILFLDDSSSTTDGIDDLDSNVNLNGGGDQRIFQLGVQIGVGGIGQNDDYRSVTFDLDAAGLDITDFAKVGVRLQAVGDDRNGSSKLEGEIPKTFSISGQKFEDLTGDGKTADDIAWAYTPVTIFIDNNANGSYDDGIDRQQTTGTDGTWSIDGLTLADVGKKIYELAPNGSEQTGVVFQEITNPGSGGIDTGNDFTNFRNFSISGQKFEDLTGDGKTADDKAWSYGAVELFVDDDKNGSFSTGDRTITTGVDGTWSFSGLTLADVGKNIYEKVPTGSEQTGVVFQSISNPGSGGIDAGNDFTNFRNFSISGQKFEDLTGDGKTADDKAWAYDPVTIFIDNNANGSYDNGIDRQQTTGTDGTWSIDGLTLADVGKKIYELAPNGSEQTGVVFQEITNPGSGGTDAGNDFTNFRNFSISGQKFEDLTGDGKTADDKAWSYGAVELFVDDDKNGSFSTGDRTITTGVDGTWSFGGLTLADVGKNIYEKVPTGSQQTGVVFQSISNPGSGGIDAGNDFTNFKLFNVSGTKFLDKTGNGITGDDTGLGGVTIFIDKDGDGKFTTGELNTVTDSNGAWSFSNLGADLLNTKVYEVLPSGYMQTVGNAGYTLPSTGGQDQTNLNFANFKPVGPGTGTLGFWKQWTAVWDGNTSNDGTFNKKANFPTKDILYSVTDPVSGIQTAANGATANANRGILIGDFNFNGSTDSDEKTIFYTVDEAKAILNSSVGGQDSRYILGQQLITSWLNVVAGNTYDTVIGSVKQDIVDGVIWLQNATPNEGGDAAGDGNLTLNAATFKLPSSDPRWSTPLGNPSLGNGQFYGSQIKDVLDYYNNTGGGFAINRDGGVGSLTTLAALQTYRQYF